MLRDRIAHVRNLCAGWVEQGHTPTLGVCVARRGVIVLNEAFGVMGPGPDSTPLAPDVLFAIASLTKPVTATLVMQLVEDGLLGLNRPAKDYLPELSGDGTNEILVHHLLTHTTGYPFQGCPFTAQPPWLEHAEKKLAAGFEPVPCPEGQDPSVHRWLSLFWDAPRIRPFTCHSPADVDGQTRSRRPCDSCVVRLLATSPGRRFTSTVERI